MHPSCAHSLSSNAVCVCSGDDCDGVLVLGMKSNLDLIYCYSGIFFLFLFLIADAFSKPNFKMGCNVCNVSNVAAVQDNDFAVKFLQHIAAYCEIYWHIPLCKKS